MTKNDKLNRDFYNNMHYGFEDEKEFEDFIEETESQLPKGWTHIDTSVEDEDEFEDDILISENW